MFCHTWASCFAAAKMFGLAYHRILRLLCILSNRAGVAN